MDLTTVLIVVFVLAAVTFFIGALTGLINAFNSVPCEHCRKPIAKNATVCPYCQRDR